jgi:hypothetical protein
MTIDVPAGSYVVTARLQGKTVIDPDGPPGNSYRYNCSLEGGGTSLDRQDLEWAFKLREEGLGARGGGAKRKRGRSARRRNPGPPSMRSHA